MTIKVLNIGMSKNPGGVENLVLNYYLNINRKEFTFDFVDIYGEGIAFSEKYKNLGSEIYTLPNFKKNTILFSKKFLQLVKEKNYDVIHIHMQSAANILVVLLSMFSKNSKVICHSHSTSTPKGILRKILDYVNKYIIRKLNVEKFACGKKAGIWMFGNKFEEKNIIYNAIDYDKYKFSQDKKRLIQKKYNIKYSDFILGFVGRFGDEKNVFFLIEILKKLNEENSKVNYKLLTIGGGDLKENFLKEIKKLNLTDSYIDVGIVNDTSLYYNIMDVFLLPSFFEGVPVVAVESQSNGLETLLSSNISREIKISNRAKFLSIDSVDNWIENIKKIEKNYDREENILREYKLEFASKMLEQKYKDIVQKQKVGDKNC